MLFSVIIPTFNRRALLEQALESVWAQTFTDYEIIVVDDGSNDGAQAYLASLGGRVRWMAQSNAGPGTARNAGAAIARGEYLAFLDSDDLWPSWTLSVFGSAIARHARPSFLVGPNEHLTDAGVPLGFEGVAETHQYACFFAAYEKFPVPVPTPSSCIRRSAFDKVGGFGTGYVGEDIDLWLRLGCEDNFVWITWPPLSFQRIHAVSVTQDVERSIAGVLRLLESERRGLFPGARRYRGARTQRLSAAARSTSLAVAGAHVRDALTIYRRSFRMNIEQRRLRYLLGFPLRALGARIAWSIRGR